jgi:tRNA uridine 5-carboxymethylaminomethyl modification enzyme
MFTSRAEFRTLLRQDNADLRLTELSFANGLASQERMEKVIDKKSAVEEIKDILKNVSIEPSDAESYLRELDSAPMQQKQKAIQLLMRPSVNIKGMLANFPTLGDALSKYDKEILEQAEIQLKYDVYIAKEKEIARKMGQLEELEIPENFNYEKIGALSAEALQKFRRIKPRTLGQASRISGVNPSDVQILMVYMGR